MSLNPQQARAAYADSSVAVTAGAGTGKTHMLIERYFYHVEQGLAPLQIVAITFTEKAAEELRARVRKEAYKRHSSHGDLIAEIDASMIGTFHGLAARICREHPEAAGVSPDFNVLDNEEGKIWVAEQMDEILAAMPEFVYKNIPYSLLNQALQLFQQDPLLAKQALEQSPQDWKSLVETARAKNIAKLISLPDWESSIRELESWSGKGVLEETRVFALSQARKLLSCFKHNLPNREYFEALATIDTRRGTKADWPNGGCDEIKKTLKALKEVCKQALKEELPCLEWGAFDEVFTGYYTSLQTAFQFMWNEYGKAKRRQRLLDFNDLEIHALKALEPSEVRDYYAERWKAFMVDEFQDTNPTQERVLVQLTAQARITVVGDEKQSIYAFRRADVTVFQRFRDRIRENGGQVEALVRCYRTHKPLIDSLNGLFEPILDNLHQSLEAERMECPFEGPALEVYVLEGKGNMGDRRPIEARHTAKLIKQWLDEGRLVQDRHTGEMRPMLPKDIAVLSRAWKPLTAFNKALENLGIPSIQAGGGNLLETREAKDGIALLRFLANPDDDLALAALLRSPFLGVSDRTLYMLATKLAKRSWWQALCEDREPLLDRARQILGELLRVRSTESPSRLLQRGDRLTGYSAVVANLSGGPRHEADWRGFQEFVQRLETTGCDVFLVARRIRRILKAEVVIPRPLLEVGDAVTLMSIHGSKGLEWPVVIVPELCRDSQNITERLLLSELGLGLKMEDDTSALYPILKAARKETEEAERRRLFYVACTRARDLLVLSSPAEASRQHTSFLDFALPALDEMGLVPSPMVEVDQAEPLVVSKICPPESERLVGKSGSGICELPVTALSEYLYCPERFRLRYGEGHPGMGEGEAIASKIGTLSHLALDRGINDPKILARYVPELEQEQVLTAFDLAQAFREDSVYETFRGIKAEREFPVQLSVRGVALRGVVDLLGPDFVLDYKTSQHLAPEHHRLQLWAYAKATGREKAHLAYLRQRKLFSYERAELEVFESEAVTLVERIKAGDFAATPTADRCSQCGYAGICRNC